MVGAQSATSGVRSSSDRVLQLDILRGVAVLLVLGCHLDWALPASIAGRLRRVSRFFGTFGWTGVDLFFVLSGFLIGGLLFSEIRKLGELDVKRFLIRRGFKIWPAYYVLLAVNLFTMALEHDCAGWSHLGAHARDLLANVVHLQNYRATAPPRGLTWSLAVEEHFYLTLPILLLVLLRRGKITLIPWIAIGTMIVCTGWRCIDTSPG